MQLADSEAELERLSRALETQKQAAADAELAGHKRAEELSKDVQSKAADIENLKQRLKQYGDYDEIKRELEIMKVCWVESRYGCFD